MATERQRLERAWSVLRCQAPGGPARWRYRYVGMVSILYCSNSSEPMQRDDNLERGAPDYWERGSDSN